MNFRTFLAELKADFQRDFTSGLIDEQSVAKWVTYALGKFGANVLTLQEGVVYVKRGVATLPDNYEKLQLAAKCDVGCVEVEEDVENVLIESRFWRERTERELQWDSCSPSCKKSHDKTIVENYFYKGTKATFRYTSPTLLKLGKTMKRDSCASECRNLVVQDCEHEISILGKTMYTNFTEGVVYLQYYGIEVDEDGMPIIPETFSKECVEYIEYYVKRRLYEVKASNKDDANYMNLLNYYRTVEREQFALAFTAVLFEGLPKTAFSRIQRKNRAEMLQYEALTPII
jgi:hypothetical protein